MEPVTFLSPFSNIWAAATRAQPTLAACTRVLSDIKPPPPQPQLTEEFAPDSNYTCGLFSFARLTDIPLTSGGVRALEAPRQVNLYCSDWLSSSLVLLGRVQMRINSDSLGGELLECSRFKYSMT